MRILNFFLIILILFPVLAIAGSNQQEVMKVLVDFKEGVVSISSVEIGYGFVPEKAEVSKTGKIYWLEAIGHKGELLNRTQFDISPQRSIDFIEEEGEESIFIQGEEKRMDNTLLVISYSPNIKWLNLYDANRNFIEKRDVSEFSRVCGNNICQNQETEQNCPQDCLIALGEKNNVKANIFNSRNIVLFIILLLAFVLMFMGYKIIKNRNN